MPNALNARIGRIRPSPVFAYLSEIPEAETERTTARRRPADRGSLDAVQSVIKRCIARVFARTRGTATDQTTLPRSAADPSGNQLPNR